MARPTSKQRGHRNDAYEALESTFALFPAKRWHVIVLEKSGVALTGLRLQNKEDGSCAATNAVPPGGVENGSAFPRFHHTPLSHENRLATMLP